MNKPQTPKRQQFPKEYIIDLNATQAAIRSGYSEKTANRAGPRLLSNVVIQDEIQRLIAERSERTQTTAEWVLNNFKEIHKRCMQAEPVMIKVKGKLVESGEYKFDSTGANRANENIGRHINFYEKDKDDGDKTPPQTIVNIGFSLKDLGSAELSSRLNSGLEALKR